MRNRQRKQSNKERRLRLQIARISLINELYLRIINMQVRNHKLELDVARLKLDVCLEELADEYAWDEEFAQDWLASKVSRKSHFSGRKM